MSAAIVNLGKPDIRPFARTRQTTPRLTLRSTATGWALFDESPTPVFASDGAEARRACLQRALALGVVQLRAGEEPAVL